MKASVVILAVAGLATAQNFGAEPSCAIPCLTSAISVAGCALTDEACQCGTGQAAIQTAVTPCLLSACNAVDIGIAASVGFALCSSFNAGVSATTTASSAATTSPSSSAPLTSSSKSSSGSGSSASSSAPKTTTVTASTTSVPATTSKPASSTTAASNTTVTTSKPPAVSSAGAQALVVGLGSVAGLVAGLMAAL